MYGLPNDFNASVFEGKEIVQICFTINTISILLSDDVIVSVLGSFIHLESPMSPDVIQIVPLLTSNLMSLIGKKVLHAEANKDGKLSLHFDNGHILTLLDDLKQYESYIIQINNKEIVV